MFDISYLRVNLLNAIFIFINVYEEYTISFEATMVIQALLIVKSSDKALLACMMELGKFARYKNDSTLVRLRRVFRIPCYNYDCVYEDYPMNYIEALDYVLNGSPAPVINVILLISFST